MPEPLVSICIPAYKKPQFVVRCLESIARQDYKSVEIVISDDSPGEDIKQAIQPFKDVLNVNYFRNQPSLGSPKNWNRALDSAKGSYVVLMHQDDWLHDNGALTQFVNAFHENEVDFVFCQNTAVDERGNKMVLQAIPQLLKTMTDTPNRLLLAQVIGPPSNTMLKRHVNVRYDERFIWLVDVDYYSRILKAGYRYHYIPKHLVSIGLHQDQTTEFCRSHPDIIFKENIWFAAKIGSKAFNDIRIYDYYWRLLRNYGIRSFDQIIANHLNSNEVPDVIVRMLNLQKRIPTSVLRTGVLSKCLMAVSFCSWKLNHKPDA